jgi:hypothetical protein
MSRGSRVPSLELRQRTDGRGDGPGKRRPEDVLADATAACRRWLDRPALLHRRPAARPTPSCVAAGRAQVELT